MPRTRPCTWLIESAVFGEDATRLADEVVRQGHRAVSIGAAGDVAPAFCAPGARAVLRSSVELALALGPTGSGATRFARFDAYDLRHFPAELLPFWLNRSGRALPFGELAAREAELFEQLGVDGHLFLRPCDGAKSFGGDVLYRKYFPSDLRQIAGRGVSPDTAVWAASPVRLAAEWRFVAVGDELVAGSEYRGHVLGKRRALDPPPDEVIEQAAAWAECVDDPEPAWVLDVARTAEGGLYIVELNAFTPADLYDCDLEPIVARLSALR